MYQMETYLIFFTLLLVLVYLTIIVRFHKNQNRMDNLIEENAKHLKELNSFYQSQQNPLGPLMSGVKQSVTIHFDKNGKILYSDKNFQNLLGYTNKELSRKNLHVLLNENISLKDPLDTSIIRRIFANPKLYTENETELETKGGKKVWISWTNRIIYNKKNQPVEIHSVGFDITKRKNLESDLMFLASVDPTTGALNRQAFLQTGTRELRRSIRYHHPLSILLVKLTLKGETNLNLPERDKLLKELTQQCKKTMRDVDYLGRIGEVELALLLPETSISNVIHVQKRLEENLNRAKKEKGLFETLVVRFGATGYTKERSIDEMIIKAYKILEKGKKNATHTKK